MTLKSVKKAKLTTYLSRDVRVAFRTKRTKRMYLCAMCIIQSLRSGKIYLKLSHWGVRGLPSKLKIGVISSNDREQHESTFTRLKIWILVLIPLKLVRQNNCHYHIRALPVRAPLQRSTHISKQRVYRILLSSIGTRASHPHWRNFRNIPKSSEVCKQAVQKPYLTLTQFMLTPQATIWFKHWNYSHWLMTTRKLASFCLFYFSISSGLKFKLVLWYPAVVFDTFFIKCSLACVDFGNHRGPTAISVCAISQNL